MGKNQAINFPKKEIIKRLLGNILFYLASYSPSSGTLLLPLAAPPAVVVGYPGFQVPAFAVAGAYPGGQVVTFAIAGAYPDGQVVTPAVAAGYLDCQDVASAVAAGYLSSQVVTSAIAGACISDPYAILQKFRPLKGWSIKDQCPSPRRFVTGVQFTRIVKCTKTRQLTGHYYIRHPFLPGIAGCTAIHVMPCFENQAVDQFF